MKTERLLLLFTLLVFVLTPFCKNYNSSDSTKSKQILDFVANKKELAWLKANSVHIKTVKTENGFNDLVPIKTLIGNAQIVGLGEFTHGTS